MRVPDLDWPVDLFTNVIMPVPETIQMACAVAPAEPALTPTMGDLRTADRGDPAAQWPVPTFAAAQIAV